jgi:hypothetical protein
MLFFRTSRARGGNGGQEGADGLLQDARDDPILNQLKSTVRGNPNSQALNGEDLQAGSRRRGM